MQNITIPVSTGESKILIGEKIQNLQQYLPGNRIVIITDTNVKRLYYRYFPPFEIIEIGTGEKIKNLGTVQYIYKKLIELEVDRSFFMLGIGGGIVCDITGFAASTYMRGLKFGFVSTTLLSQVDGSIGGKNGVNFLGFKNLVGVFSQPEFVICDLNLLTTLKENDFLSGFAEIVKHAAIKSKELFEYLENNYSKAIQGDLEIINKLVYDSLIIKSSIVAVDEKEKGERKKLNFGHTFGHSIEKITGITHGKAVSIGMTMASRLSVQKGLLPEKEAYRIESLLRKFKLPTSLDLGKEKIFEVLKKDKKREGNSINLVLLNRIGNAKIETILIKDLEKLIYDLY